MDRRAEPGMGCSLLRDPASGLSLWATGWRKQAPQPLLQGRGCGIRLLVPPGHSLGLGALVLVAAPADGFGPLLVVAQVPLYHVMVSSAPTAVFGELDTCGGEGGGGGAGCQGAGGVRPPLPCLGPRGQ